MPYTVTAPLVVVKDQNDRNHHVYRGGYVPWLNDEQKAHFLSLSLVEEIKAGEHPAPTDFSDGTPPVDALMEKPKKTALKGDWVRFGISKGNSAAELEAMSKEDLVELLDEF